MMLALVRINRSSRQSGFTLIELMITLAIVAILAAIVVPSYNAQVRKTRRSDAINSLMQFAQDLERCRSDTNAYDDAACTDFSGGGVPSSQGFYAISSAVADGGQQTATTFTLIATPVAGQPQEDDTQCATFSIAQTGATAAEDDGGVDATATCWQQ